MSISSLVQRARARAFETCSPKSSRAWLTPLVLATAALLGGSLAARAVASDGEHDGDGTSEEQEIQFDNYDWDGLLQFAPGSLGFHFTAPGYDPIDFHSEVSSLPGFPGGYYIPTSPFGAGAILLDTAAGAPDYVMLFPAVGAVLPMSWEHDLGGYGGASGALGYQVVQDPVTTSQGPKVTFEIDPKTGERVIEISQAGSAFFVQFCTIKMSWKGIDSNGNPTSGPPPALPTMPGPGNLPFDCNGGTVYVDSDRPSGQYGGETGTRTDAAGNTSTYMRDAPRITNPAGVAANIEGQPLNQGVKVTEITVEFHMTTYIGVTTPAGSVITHVFEWTRTITYTIDDCGLWHPNADPTGGYGPRPGAPTGPQPAGGMATQHGAAYAVYTGGPGGQNPGAGASGGW